MTAELNGVEADTPHYRLTVKHSTYKNKTQHIVCYREDSLHPSSVKNKLVYIVYLPVVTFWSFFFFFFELNIFFCSLFLCSFGLAPAGPLQVLTPLSPNQSVEVSLPLSTVGPVMKMDPLTNLQVLTNSQLFVLAQLTGRESFFLFYLTAALNSQVVTKTELKR